VARWHGGLVDGFAAGFAVPHSVVGSVGSVVRFAGLLFGAVVQCSAVASVVGGLVVVLLLLGVLVLVVVRTIGSYRPLGDGIFLGIVVIPGLGTCRSA